MFAFIRRHWAASLALLLATLTAAAVIATCILFPPAIAAVAGFAIFGATPLAFLATMAAPAAIATVAAISFGLSLAASTLFNAVVSIYNRMDKAIAPEMHKNDYLPLEMHDSETRHSRKTNNGLMNKLLGCFDCCSPESTSNKKKATTNNAEPVQTGTRMFPQQTVSMTQQRPTTVETNSAQLN